MHLKAFPLMLPLPVLALFVLIPCNGLAERKHLLPKEVHSVDVLMPGVHVDLDEIYLCSAFAPLDAENITHYLVGFEPKAESKRVHHLILYGCDEPGSDVQTWECGEMTSQQASAQQSRYPHAKACASTMHILYSWANNAPKLHLPEGVGFRIGGRSRFRRLVLQVHYMHQMDAQDQSGVRVLLTREHQPRAAATLVLYNDVGRIEPGKTEPFEVACTIREPVLLHPFAFRVHTHARGLDVAGWRVRGAATGKGTERQWKWTLLGQRDPQMDQLFVMMADRSLTIEQGDVLAARCIMQNNLTRAVEIGSTGDDEMCNFYVMYWTDGDRALEQSCISSGPPHYAWSNSSLVGGHPLLG